MSAIVEMFGKCVFVGWETVPDEEGRERFVAKVEFTEPPKAPLWVAWGAQAKLTCTKPEDAA